MLKHGKATAGCTKTSLSHILKSDYDQLIEQNDDNCCENNGTFCP